MTNQELTKQLNSLSAIKPNQTWKETNREILYSQISNSSTPIIPEKSLNAFLVFLNNAKELVAQPTFVLVSIFLIAFGIVGTRAAYTRPGDSLFIARVISEKAQLAMTFNEEAKTKKEIQFANNHAQEIAQILADENNQAQTEKLASDFKSELNIVKTKIKPIANNTETKPTDNDDAKVFSASVGHDNQGLQISPTEEKATTPSNDPHQMIDEAQTMFDQKDYSGAETKLKEVSTLLNNPTPTPDTSDNATSTK